MVAEVRERFGVSEAYRNVFSPPTQPAAEPPRSRCSSGSRGSGTRGRTAGAKRLSCRTVLVFLLPSTGLQTARSSGPIVPKAERTPQPPKGFRTGERRTGSRLSEASRGRVRQTGRGAIRVEGTRPGVWYPPEPLWWGADDYAMVGDAERGAILRLASGSKGGRSTPPEFLRWASTRSSPRARSSWPCLM
jgi:hypothetical protein